VALATGVAETSAAILPGTRLWRLPSLPAPALWADARALRHILGHVLADAVRALHARNARELNDGILETVHRFAGSVPLRDDLTLVTVKRV
jgi:hypothetical protein